MLPGFILGVLASILAAAIYQVAGLFIPSHRYRRLAAVLKNPQLRLRLRRGSDERAVAQVIEELFQAWKYKDVERYQACWADTCNRFTGAAAEEREDRDAILRSFRSSCGKYKDIKVPALVIENVMIGPAEDRANVIVFYRFNLRRAEDELWIQEEAQEVYALQRIAGQWKIYSNIDRYAPIGSKRG